MNDGCTSYAFVWLLSMSVFATHVMRVRLRFRNSTDLEPSTWFHVSWFASGSVPSPTDGSDRFVSCRAFVCLAARTAWDVSCTCVSRRGSGGAANDAFEDVCFEWETRCGGYESNKKDGRNPKKRVFLFAGTGGGRTGLLR